WSSREVSAIRVSVLSAQQTSPCVQMSIRPTRARWFDYLKVDCTARASVSPCREGGASVDALAGNAPGRAKGVLPRRRAWYRRGIVVVPRQPAHHRVAVARQTLVINERRVEALQHAVQPPRPLRHRDQFPEAQQVTADAKQDGVA